VEFPFRSLVQRAARLSLGGEREIALAALTAARFARSCVGSFQLAGSLRQARAAASRVWFSTLALPARARLAALRVVDASAGDDPQSLVAALDELIDVAGPVLDRAANSELRTLAKLAQSRAGT
jgi:hypothetical protein